MTDKELKEKILAEIERLINELGEQRDVNLEDLRDFINSLPEEPVSEGLEEAANKYADNADYVYADVSIEDFTVETFKAGANYVFEKFVDIVNKNTMPNGMEDRGKMAYDMLILIEQLKK